MYRRILNLLALCVLVAAAAATWYWSRPREDVTPAVGTADDRPPSYYLKDATLLQTNDEGRVLYRIDAQFVEERPDDSALVADDVLLEWREEESVPWRVRAGRAVVRLERQLVELEQGVELVREPRSDGEVAIVRTESLSLEPQPQVARTDGDVNFQVGASTLTATGLNALLKEDFVELKSSIRGLLVAACAGCAAHAGRAQDQSGDLVVEGPFRYNGATGRWEMTDVTLSQGDISVSAARGSAVDVSLDTGGGRDYRLEGGVQIRSPEALITADVGEFVTRNERLERFVLSGSPARFEDLAAGNAERAFGEADRLVYDALEGIMSLEGEVRVVVGPNEFRGCDLIYDLNAEEVSSGESECDQPLQIITIAPGENGSGRQGP